MTRTMTHEARLLAYPPTREVARVLNVSLKEDTGWMPRWSATVTCVTTAELLDNPPEYLTIQLSRIASHAIPLKAWSRAWRGRVGDMTALGARAPYALTEQTGGAGDAAPPAQLQVTLIVRNYAHDLTRGETTIALTGCEMVLEDRKLLLEPKYIPADSNLNTFDRADTGFAKGKPVRDMLTEILSLINAGLIETPATTYLLRDLYIWKLGTSPDSFISEILEDLDLMLWAEAPESYKMRARSTSTPLHQVNAANGLIDAEYTNDIGAANLTGGMRLAEAPGNSYVEINYYGDAPGLINGTFTETTIRASPTWSNGYPVNSIRSPSKTRTGSRSHVIRAEVVSDYQYRADDRAHVAIPGKLDRTGKIRSVNYKYPGGLAELDIESVQPAT